MNKFISINPLCQFATTTSERKKKSIIKDQKKPSTYKVASYSTARARMKRFFEYGFSKNEIIAGIEAIQNRRTVTQFTRNVTELIRLRHYANF